MSNEIDNKVVSLTFDNASFQSKVGDTLSTLEKLRQSLNFSKGKESMGELQSAASKFNMGGMGTAIEGISTKFLAMATVGITALANITNRAIDAGISIAKSLTLTPVMDGFQEYETNMNSIQTILANTKSKGSTLEDVNSALDQLNEYSDKTIYNFAQMAKNVGTFTAAGVDLQTSVNSIKGIANLAAMSGVNSERAAGAMYQLSQAISSGTVKLIDWNSVEQAGIGGEGFKTALFEAGKAMGKLNDVPIDKSFAQWSKEGNSFRETLTDGWLTADVLTTTLGAMSGDLDGAALSAKGFSDSQIVMLQDMASTAVAAATEVKTASQLFGTIKEAIGTGWATTFRTVVGDFVEAKQLFTGLNNFIGGFITNASNARNELLSGWKTLGGRDVLVQGLLYSLSAVKSALEPIRDAFRTVFPPTTAQTLFDLTTKFRDFAKGLIVSADTAEKIKSIFLGIFSIFKIGVEIVKGIFSVFMNLGKILFGFVGMASGGAAATGNFINKLREMLVEGGGIQAFFDKINQAIQKFGEFLFNVKDKIAGLFGGDGGVPGGEKTASIFETIADKLGFLSTAGDKVKSVFSTIGDIFINAFGRVKDAVTTAWDAIIGFFSTIGQKIGDVFTADAFKPALGAVSVGLFAGLVKLFRDFVKNGLKLDFGQFSLFEKIGDIFDQLGDTMKAFQLKIKADALLRIAAAIAVLTASILVLSFIDSAKLAASLGALAVGFGQLVAAMALLAKIETNPAKMIALATSMIILGGAALVLSLALKSMSTMSWGEMAKGLLGVLGALQLMSMATQFFGDNNSSFIRAGISIGVLSVSLLIFAGVIKLMAGIGFGDLAHGLLAVGASLGLFVGAMNLIPEAQMGKIGISFGLFSISLILMKKAVEGFAEMSWSDMIRGFVGLAGALLGITVLVKNLPKGKELILVSAGLVAISAAIWIMSKALETIGNMSLGDLAKSLVGIGALLFGLVVATNALQGASLGVGAILVVAAGLLVLAKTLEIIGNLSIGQLITGLVGIAAVLVILGLAATALVAFPPLLGALIGMGVALGAIGLGFALLGAGAYLTAQALVALGSAGKKSMETLVEILNIVIKAIPGFAQAFAEGVISFIQVITDAAPGIIENFGKILTQMLDLIIELMPKIGEAFSALIDMIVKIVVEKSPEIIAAGIALLLNFLQGIRDNIYQIVDVAIELLNNFTQSLADNAGLIGAAAGNLVVAFITAIASYVQTIINAGVDLLVQFLNGIANNLGKVIEAAANVILTFIAQVGAMAVNIANAGTDALIKFLDALTNNATEIATKVTNLITTIIIEIGKGATRIGKAGTDSAIKFLEGMADNAVDFTNKLGAVVVKVLEGLRLAVDKYSPQIRDEGVKLAGALINGLTGGIAGKAKDVLGAVGGLAGNVIGFFKDKIESKSPSKVFYRIGQDINQGLINGLDKNHRVQIASANLATDTVTAFSNAMSKVKMNLEGIDEFNPTITPVLDLTNITRDAKSVTAMLGGSTISASLSYASAASIAKTTDLSRSQSQQTEPQVITKEVKFEQNNYSPKALTTNDVYRNTRSQVSLAKKELSIP
jgi:tape measure domain-containing protein